MTDKQLPVPPKNDNSLLQVVGVSKSFGAVRALDSVGLSLRDGEVMALLGENGAGKSTLARILSGIFRPDAGTIQVDGTSRVFESPRAAQQVGIATIHQDLSLVPLMSVADNLALGYEPVRPWQLGRLDTGLARSRSSRALERVGLHVPLDKVVAELTTAEQQVLEIARAVDRAARILIMDEPTARLTRAETEHLFALIGELKRSGIAVIYISHRLAEIWEISDRITILRDGKDVAAMPLGSTSPAQVIELMAGREVDTRYPMRTIQVGEPVLEVQGLTKEGLFEEVSLTVRRGEILGIAGLVGSGRSELVSTIFGQMTPDAGTAKVHGHIVTARHPSTMIQRGLALIPEKQTEEGIFASLDLVTNITVPILKRFCRGIWLSVTRQRTAAATYVQKLDIQAPSLDAPLETLSGGNRQKTIVARWLASGASIFLMDEATAGIDVEVKFELYKLLSEMTGGGAAVVWVSSDLSELLGLCDRILVMAEGRVVRSFDKGDAQEGSVLSAMFGRS